MTDLSDLNKRIQQIIQEAYRSAGTGDSVAQIVKRKVADLVRSYSLQGVEEKELERAAQTAMRDGLAESDAVKAKMFNEEHASNPERQKGIRQSLQPFINRAKLEKSASLNKMPEIVADAMVRATKNGGDWRKGARQAARQFQSLEHHVRTEVESAKAALDRNARVQNAIDAGGKHFRYVGPSRGLRKMCAKWLNGIFSVEEIEKLDNGQGLPVLTHGGGYNCRHRWAHVVDRIDGWQDDLEKQLDGAFWEGPLSDVPARKIVEGFTIPGASLGMRLIKAYDTDRGASRVSFQITNVAGEESGVVERTFMVTPRGKKVVKHDLLQLYQGAKGRGVSKELWRSAAKLYDEVGVERIHVHAAMSDGHIAWAKYGFKFDDVAAKKAGRAGDQAGMWRRMMARWLHEKGVDVEALAPQLAKMTQPKQFINFAVEHEGKMLTGVEFKQMHMFDWYGVMDYTPGSAGRRRLEKYLAKDDNGN
jgi:hypothetical protein